MENNVVSKSKPVVVITGFGIFQNYKNNPSWEAVKIIDDLPNVNLIKKQIDVVYETVDKQVPEIWEEHKPSLVVHVGVSCIAKGIVLETCANSSGFCKADANRCFLDSESSKLSNGCVECLTTELDIKSICDHLNQLHQSGKLKLSSTISTNAGRYLCEYIYYTSLKFDKQKTLFVHVPDVDEKLGFTVDNISDALKAILEYLISKL